VIALTAEGPAGDRIECLKAGMDDFLAKPLDIDRLTLLLEKYLPDSLQEELPASRESDTETVSVEVPLSIEAALPRFGGDSEIYFDFLNHFIRQLKQTDAQMRAAYQNGDVSQLHSISHSLKGTAANFEANGICKAAGALEELTYNNTLVGAFTLINDISNEISALEAFCRNHTAPRKKTLISHPAGDGN
jgi:HPt (histidine-containing phosphotransfer) domain-containing protein